MNRIPLIICRHELNMLRRNKSVVAGSLLIIAILLMSVWTGAQYYGDLSEQHAAAEETARAQWEGQEAKNPHSAAHYGTHAFKPVTVLSVLDPGVDRYTGVSLFLEAHRQNVTGYSPAEDHNTLSRFGDLNAAFIFSFLFPLLIIFTGYRMMVQERETRMYHFMRSLGVTDRQQAAGKALALWVVTGVMFLPFILVTSGFLIFQQVAPTEWIRFTGMMLTWVLYAGVCIHITIWVSSRVRSSSNALVLLLGVWIISTLAAPRLITNVASAVYPVPDAITLEQYVQADLDSGIDGHNPLNQHTAAFRDSVMAAHNAESPSDLPFNLSGLMLQVSEEYEKRVYDRHRRKVDTLHDRQVRLYRAASFVSPTLVAQLASMGFAGTDIHAHRDFYEQAEEYRFQLMTELNEHLKKHAVGDDAYGFTAGNEFYKQTVSYRYERPETIFSGVPHALQLVLLSVWFLAGLICLSYPGTAHSD